jgi:ubiquinone/menaquinone biosynthesis C-methylase UbiE
VSQHFARAADQWDRIYELDGLPHRIIRARHSLALRWVDSLPLSTDAEVLEVGGGAGRAAVAIAQRGYRVHSVDLVPEMLALTVRSARDAGVTRLTTSIGDAHALELADGRFDLVIALGVLPWLHTEARALAEMARVLRGGGWLIASADNRNGLHELLDPRKNPSLAPLRSQLRRWLHRPRREEDLPSAKTHGARQLSGLLRDAGLETVRWSTVGFGPFSLLGRPLFSERSSVALQERLQPLAEREFPILQSTGAHHLILARKPA